MISIVSEPVNRSPIVGGHRRSVTEISVTHINRVTEILAADFAGDLSPVPVNVVKYACELSGS